MPKIGHIKRNEFVKNLNRLGFAGPFPGSKHQLMRSGDISVRLHIKIHE